MKHLAIAGVACVLTITALAGCSSGESNTEETAKTTAGDSGGTSAESATTQATPAPGTLAAEPGRVTFGSNDAGPVTGVVCQTEGGVTTITVEATPRTTVVLTDEAVPVVKSVSIGEAGSDAASLVYIEGVSAAPQAVREGPKFTVTGNGTGTTVDDPANPVDMPFEIAVSCP
jgi:lipoprotein LpqH